MIDSLKIMGTKIKINVLPKKELEESMGDKDVHGQYCASDYRIDISQDLSSEAQKRILLHEICHSLLSISGLSHLIGSKLEEAICDASENYLELIRNKEFVKFMQLQGESSEGKKV